MKIKNYIALLGFALLLYLILIPAIYGLQRFIVFQPVRLNSQYIYHFDTSFEEINLESEDGVILNNLYFCAENDTTKGVVLYFHGNADNLIRWSRYRKAFTERGYDVMMVDYRGFGKSGGKPDEVAYYKDARMVYDWLRRQTPPDKIFLYGRSLGCAIAAELTTKSAPPLLVLETPFNDIGSVIRTRFPFVYLPYKLDFTFSNLDYLQEISCPVFIFLAEEDEVVPNSCTEKLIPVLKEGDLFIRIEGAGHKNMADFPEYDLQMDRIFGERLSFEK